MNNNLSRVGEKDHDESVNSIDASSNDETETQVPLVVVTCEVPHLETMSTLDDVDDDEAFISDLMAMHPNDDDIVIEDLEEIDEALPPPIEDIQVPERDEATEDGVRK